jgi:hypothetical protein
MASKMDKSEQIVYQYLIHRGFADPIYEPDGNIPLDFLVDGRIAVEVRRLNQNDNSAGKQRGLEEIAIPLKKRFQDTLHSMGQPVNGSSWFVTYSYKRPLPEWNKLELPLKQALKDFIDLPSTDVANINISNEFSIRIVRASKEYSTFFVLGGFCDHDAGGFVLAEMKKNISLCIEEKHRKITLVRHKYPEWWLVLVDHTGLGAHKYDFIELHELIQINDKWDKIIVVNPLDPAQSNEL